MNNAIDVITRNTAIKTKLVSTGSLAISLSEPSVVIIHANIHHVARYERIDNDLLIYMKDGNIIRCVSYFVQDSKSNHSELIWQDEENQLTQVVFNNYIIDGVLTDVVHLQYTNVFIASIDPLLYGSISDISWGMMAAGILGSGAVVGLLSSGGGGGGGGSSGNGGTNPPEVPKIAFEVSDKTGDKTGSLTNKETTDERTPTFHGTGTPGATIYIYDRTGALIATCPVGIDGSWLVTIPTQNVGQHIYKVVQNDGANPIEVGNIILKIVEDNATLSVNKVTENNTITSNDINKGVVISGTSSNLPPGTAVLISVGGKNYTATVDEKGKWTQEIPAADFAGMPQGINTVKVSTKDEAGNNIDSPQTITLKSAPPTLTFEPISTDDLINIDELAKGVTINGTTNAKTGDNIKIMLNGVTYTTTVDDSGLWKYTFANGLLSNGENKITVSVSDKDGNTNTLSRDVQVDLVNPTLYMNFIAGDNMINATEMSGQLSISGTSEGAVGQKVTVTLNGKTYQGLVNAQGLWDVTVPQNDMAALSEGALRVTATLADKAGNIATQDRTITVDKTAPSLTTEPITGDNILTPNDLQKDLVISGTSTAESDQPVNVSFNGHQYVTKVDANGKWQVIVPKNDFDGLQNGKTIITSSVSDKAGNKMVTTTEVEVKISSAISMMSDLANDDMPNGTEQAAIYSHSPAAQGRDNHDTFSINKSNTNILLDKLINASTITDDNTANGFTVGKMNAEPIDLHQLLQGRGYTNITDNINKITTVNADGNIKSINHDDNTTIPINPDSIEINYSHATFITLNSTPNDLATLLVNHQLLSV